MTLPEVTEHFQVAKIPTNRINIVVAGASGFIGQALIPSLRAKFPEANLIALSRSTVKSPDSNLLWRSCDLFSLKALEDSLPDRVDLAIYLVHSMGPTAAMDQGSFADYDLLLADNFVRALKNKATLQMIYLGGLIPPCEHLSLHLQSRLEVERTFIAAAIPTTIFRAGLIVGAAGSSFKIMKKLVSRLPIMLCPRWTQTLTTPVTVELVIKAITDAALELSTTNESYDLASCEPLTYVQMMRETASAMKKKRLFFTVPFFTPTLSRLWVSLITGSSKALVYPLVASLEHEMVARQDKLFHPIDPGCTYLSMVKSLNFQNIQGSKRGRFKIVRKSVRSVQRLPLPLGKDAVWVREEYQRWLPKFLNPLIGVKKNGNDILFNIRFIRTVMLHLHLSMERSTSDRQLLYIEGGLLAASDNKGRLEFRVVLDSKIVIAAIHEFKPALPWWIYQRTQAVLHSWVMKSFGKHLEIYTSGST